MTSMTTEERRNAAALDEQQLIMDRVLDQLIAVAEKAGDDPGIYKPSDTRAVLECPHGINIGLWKGSREGYNPNPRRVQGVEVLSEGIWGPAYRDVPKLTRVYRFNKLRPKLRTEEQDFTFNAAAMHKCVMERVALLQARGEADAAKAEWRSQNAAIAIASLRSHSIQPREDMVDDDPDDPLSLHRIPHWQMSNRQESPCGNAVDWKVTVSPKEARCTVNVEVDASPQDVGPMLRAILSAKHSAAIESTFEHYPFTVVRNALDIVPHIIEDRLVIPESIRDKVDLRLVGEPYAEWIDLAGRAIGHVAVQVATWEASKYSDNEESKTKIGKQRQALADLEVDIRSVARKVAKGALNGDALEAQLAPIRNRLAEAHSRLCYYLAECSP
jgi:hypothetical protein